MNLIDIGVFMMRRQRTMMRTGERMRIRSNPTAGLTGLFTCMKLGCVAFDLADFHALGMGLEMMEERVMMSHFSAMLALGAAATFLFLGFRFRLAVIVF